MRLYSKLMVAAGVLAVASMSSKAVAQEAVAAEVVTAPTEVFNPHWSLQFMGGAAYTLGENKFDKLISPAAAVNVGYRFTPAFGIRFGASGWQGKGSWVAPRTDYNWKYVSGNVDAVLSLTNLFCGYNPNRVIDAYAFLGFGANVGFNNGAEDYPEVPFEKLWTGKKFFPSGRGGLGIDFNVSKVVAITAEVNATCLPDKWNSKKGSAADWQFNGLVGIKFNFGRTRVIEPVVEEVVEEVYVAPEPEPEPVVEPEPAPAPVKKLEPLKEDVFFTLNSTKIHEKEQSKIDDLVSYMKANANTKVVITGYADKDTGSATYNMKISRLRAEKVADALKAAGIAPTRITTEYKGSSVQPFAQNDLNRVAICVAAE